MTHFLFLEKGAQLRETFVNRGPGPRANRLAFFTSSCQALRVESRSVQDATVARRDDADNHGLNVERCQRRA